MAGGGVFDGGVGGVDDDERSGREELAGLPEQDTRDSVEDILDGDAVVEKRCYEAADECHVGSSGEAVTYDVADDDGESAAIEEESFVPIASDQGRLVGRPVQRGRGQAGELREGPEQPAVELGDQLVFGRVEFGAFDDFGAQLGERP
jgi:hypothetical protein